ncbi:MAG: L,D-transpeptidase [Patescibacteria group bacterium]|nr:L,D-transpeptidase [Patescibacteria group bacterium]
MSLPKIATFFVYLFAIALSFLVLSVSVGAGVMSYSSIYSLDAKLRNVNEIDINDNIGIAFNQPIVFLNSENIIITPYTNFNFDLTNDNKLLTIKHSKPFFSETKYEITLKNIRGASGMLLKNKSFVFYTSSSQSNIFKIVDNHKKSQFTQLGLSKDKYLPPESSIPKDGIKIEPKIKNGKYIDISVSNQVMTLFEDGIKDNGFLISSGTFGMPTPLGTFSVRSKRRNVWSSYGLWMPYSMNFYGGYFIHELPYWPNGYREGTNHLGMRVSHGCIRLGIGPAEYVYNWSEIGTPIYIHW